MKKNVVLLFCVLHCYLVNAQIMKNIDSAYKNLQNMINQEVSPDSFIHLMSTYPITDDLGLSLISNFSNNSTGMNSSLDKYKNLFVKINKSSYMNFLQTKTDTDTVYFDFIES